MFTGRLIEHEEQETGSVSASTYIGFLRYAGGEHNLMACMFFFEMLIYLKKIWNCSCIRY